MIAAGARLGERVWDIYLGPTPSYKWVMHEHGE